MCPEENSVNEMMTSLKSGGERIWHQVNVTLMSQGVPLQWRLKELKFFVFLYKEPFQLS